MFVPQHIKTTQTYVLDGDLPKANCFLNSKFSKKLSASDGAVHTVVVGRMIGLSPNELKILANHNIHIHVYNENHISEEMITCKYRKIASNHFHVHNIVHSCNGLQNFLNMMLGGYIALTAIMNNLCYVLFGQT